MTPQERRIFIIIMLMVIPAPLAVDEYTPSLPAMVKYFDSTAALLQLSVTIFMLTFACSQAFFGPLSDMIGRKKIFLWIAPIFFIGNLLALFSSNIAVFLIGRGIMGIGAGVMAFTVSVLLADSFHGEKLNRVASYFSTGYSLVPISGPVVGGLLQRYFGWHANFMFIMTVFSAVYFVYVLGAPETNKNPTGYSFNRLLAGYKAVLTSRKFVLSVLSLFAIWGTIISFSVMGPFLYQNIYGVTPAVYGIFALFSGLGVLCGNLSNTQVLKRVHPKKIVWTGLALWLVTASMFFAWSLFESNALGVTIFTFLTTYAGGLIFPNLYAIGASSVPKYNGAANALMGTCILIGAVVITSIETRLNAHSAIDLAAVYLILACVSTLFTIGLNKDFVT